jgi:hypothetical protein
LPDVDAEPDYLPDAPRDPLAREEPEHDPDVPEDEDPDSEDGDEYEEDFAELPGELSHAEHLEQSRRILDSEAGSVLRGMDPTSKKQAVLLARKGAEVDIDRYYQRHMYNKTRYVREHSRKLLKRYCTDKEMVQYLLSMWQVQLSMCRTSNDVVRVDQAIQDTLVSLRDSGGG